MSAQPDPHQPANQTARIAALEAAIDARDRFIATIGHEMRNPMVPILLSVDRLRRFAAAGQWEKLAASLDLLDRATAAFMRRATQLLDVSRFAGGDFALETRPVDLSALLLDTALRHVEIARRGDSAFTWAVPGGVMVDGDQPAIEQMLDNIMANAFKYGAGRPVALSLDCEPAHAVIRVTDHGCGIPPAAQSRIFALFERTGDSDAPGLGIGLWIASRLAGAMGGTIEVTSKPGEGAIFTIRLMLRSGDNARDA